jgi:hypothetical protein
MKFDLSSTSFRDDELLSSSESGKCGMIDQRWEDEEDE